MPLARNLNVLTVRLAFSLACAVHPDLLMTFFSSLLGVLQVGRDLLDDVPRVSRALEHEEELFLYEYLGWMDVRVPEKDDGPRVLDIKACPGHDQCAMRVRVSERAGRLRDQVARKLVRLSILVTFGWSSRFL